MAPPSLKPGNVARLVSEAKAALAAVPRRARQNHSVCGAVMDRHGRIYTGINLYHFTGGPCGEPVAIANAVGQGVLPDELVACVAVARVKRANDVTSDSSDSENEVAVAAGRRAKALPLEEDVEGMKLLNPCGRCRQQLLDLNPKIDVVVVDEAGEIKVVSIEELLPYAYVGGRRKRGARNILEGAEVTSKDVPAV